ncbi:hypothetical protein TUM18999_59100 [Pseudomonas tohonis]|uniref:Uncharacterized protein n=2 Tax=Pseudomonas tohonis TaxID=2725477 RepID=A0A6J4EEE3_9PSED|nr:hypothetical protein TUM18999_59100 [Pseudomonas tohonis]GJN54150.1 hypothetical protein TUM20286_39020 [Pseudomonas tohonis]
MVVRLDEIPAPAPQPAPPRLWVWLGLLLICVVLGVCLVLWLAESSMTEEPGYFWWHSLGLPLLAWCGLGALRALVFTLQKGAADGWDAAREEDRLSKVNQGRRSQQVLVVSLHTALRDEQVEDIRAQQLKALQGKVSALRAQASWQGESAVRHSRLPIGEMERSVDVLQRLLSQVFADMSQVLASFPPDLPLALHLDVNTSLSDKVIVEAWKQAWAGAGIRRALQATEGNGLAVIDQWLDHRANDQALLMIIAFQVAPGVVEESTEAVVGMLFGSGPSRVSPHPHVYLHRPEQEREPSTDGLVSSIHQALNWAQIGPGSLDGVWLSGIDHQRQADVGTALERLGVPATPQKGQHNLDTILGRSGKAAPWLAIAAAAQAIQLEGRPQLTLCGDGTGSPGLWCTAIRPIAVDLQG